MAPAISKPASDAPQKPEESGTPYANLLKAQNRQPDAFDRAVMTWQAVTNGISKAGSSIVKLAKKAKNKRDGVPDESFPDPRLQGIGKRECSLRFQLWVLVSGGLLTTEQRMRTTTG